MIQCKNKTTGMVLSLSSCESHVIRLNMLVVDSIQRNNFAERIFCYFFNYDVKVLKF